MKRNVLWLIVAMMFSTGVVKAQMEMQVSITRASAAPFPTSALAYYSNPMNYFNLTVTPIDGRSHDVFLEMTLSSDATTTKIWTDNRFVGVMPKINIPSMGKKFGSQEFVQHFYRRLNTNLSESYRGSSDLTLLEGTYHLCIYVHDYYDTARVIGSGCLTFDICYSGTAPEFTSPTLTPSTTGYDKLIPARKTNFSWTGVVSNCFEPNAFNYIIKFVEVYPGQNVQEAIDGNPVRAALDCGHRTFFTFDYRTYPYLKLDSGQVYAAQVEAVAVDETRAVNLVNEGKSQYLVFVWCGPDMYGSMDGGGSGGSGGGGGGTTGNGDGIDDRKVSEKSNQKKVLATIKPHKLVTPRNNTLISDIQTPLVVDVETAYGDSLTTVDYTINIYEYVGDTSVSLSRQPVKTALAQGIRNRGRRTIRLADNLSSGLTAGMKYLMTVDAEAEYKYNVTYRIREVTFIDNFPQIERKDSVVVFTDKKNFRESAIFQWGGEDATSSIAPAQLTSPQQEGSDGAIMPQDGALRFSWSKPSGGQVPNSAITYDLYVFEVDSNGTWNPANSVIESKGMTSLSYTSSKALTPGRQYAAYVVTNIDQSAGGVLADNGQSRVVRFQVGSQPKSAAANQGMTVCNNSQVSNATATRFPISSLTSQNSPLRIAGFPLYVKEAAYNELTKTYSGKGSVRWSPFDKEVVLSVEFDGVQLNENKEVIAGYAQVSTTSRGYVKIGIGDRYEQNKSQAYGSVASAMGSVESTRNWFNQNCRNLGELGGSAATLPQRLPRTAISSQSNNVTVTVQDMYITPNGAAMSLLGVFYSIEDNVYLPFAATNVCTSPSSFSVNQEVELTLPKDYQVETNEGCILKMKGGASSETCALLFKNKKFDGMRFIADFDMSGTGLSSQQGGNLIATMQGGPLKIQDWDDWTTKLSMPAFKVNGTAGLVIVPQGDVLYDHSSKQTPADANLQGGNKQEWKGFYIKNYKIKLPEILSGMYADLNGKANEDIWVRTSAGVVIDPRGVSLKVNDRISLPAASNGSDNWSMSIDNIQLELENGNAVRGIMSGVLGVPMIADKMPYTCNLATSVPQFVVTPKDGNIRCSMFQGYIKPDKTSNVAVRQVGQKTQVDFTINGTMNIDFQRLGLAADVTNVKVEGMQIRNYRGQMASDSSTMHFEHYDFYIGAWSKASPQKFIGGTPSSANGSLGSADGLFFNVESITPLIDNEPTKSGYRSAGVNFSGTVRLGIGGKDSKGNPRSITAHASFNVGAVVDAQSGKLKDNTGSMDSLYISAQLDMFQLEGKIGQGKDKGWYGPLKVTAFDGATAVMNAGFGTAKDADGEDYDWWFLSGGERYAAPVEVGDIVYSGFGGLFAYNMKVDDASLLSRSADKLMSGSCANAKFTPARNQWVARGGVALAHRNPALFSAEGLVALSVENSHFARAFIYSNTSMLSDGGKPASAKYSCDAIAEYRQSAQQHVLHFTQVPQGQVPNIKYSGTYSDKQSENVNLYNFQPAEGQSNVPFSLDIVTWSGDAGPQWSLSLGGSEGCRFAVGGEWYQSTLTAGTLNADNPYKMADNLQNTLSYKSSQNQSAPGRSAFSVNSKVLAKGVAKGLFNLTVSSSIDVEGSLSNDARQGNGGVNGFTLEGESCAAGPALVSVATDNGEVNIGQAVIVSDVAYAGPNPSWACGHLDIAANTFSGESPVVAGTTLNYGNVPTAKSADVEQVFSNIASAKPSASEAEACDSKAVPHRQISFSSSLPLVDFEDQGSDILLAIPNAAGKLSPRRFCFAMSSEQSSDESLTGGSQSLRYSAGSGNELFAESARGGFEPDAIHKLHIAAAVYEKRRGLGYITDRKIDIRTGKPGAALLPNSAAWGLPLCSGSVAEAYIDTVVYLATDKAPLSLDDQVLFTWPYNGDPLVPHSEIGDACYIVMKQDRDDLFNPAALAAEGKRLFPVVVNQEMGIDKAKVCQYEYYSSDKAAQAIADGRKAYPYLKVSLPLDLVKARNASKTFSPCRVAIMLVDTAEYAKALAEAKTKARKSDADFSQFEVLESVGTNVYTLYFRLDHGYATYANLMDSIAAESGKNDMGLGYAASNVSVSPSDGTISSLIPPVNLNRFFAFGNRAYIFDSYAPADPKLYASDVVLPPIACLAVNGRQTISSEYNNHIPEWLAVNESFYYQLTYFTYNLNRAKWLIQNDTATLYEAQLIPSQPLAAPHLRVFGRDSLYTSMSDGQLDSLLISGRGAVGNTRYWFHEGSQYREPFDWALASLLQVRSDQVKRVNASHFSSTSHLSSITFVKSDPKVYIEDRVAAAAVCDNQAFARFFSQIRSYALWYSELSPVARAAERAASADLIALSLTDSPFSVYSASLVSAYDSWSTNKTRYRSTDYWFDTWLRSNNDTSYTGRKPMWTSSWIESEFSPSNTKKYVKSPNRHPYRYYVANVYYLSTTRGEKSFLNNVFAICDNATSHRDNKPYLCHNSFADVHILVNVPCYNAATKKLVSSPITF